MSGERPESPVSGGNRSHHGVMEQEKRIRREIANSNERRRMQSINAGFQSLRTLLPHHEGEKLSKVRLFCNICCIAVITKTVNCFSNKILLSSSIEFEPSVSGVLYWWSSLDKSSSLLAVNTYHQHNSMKCNSCSMYFNDFYADFMCKIFQFEIPWYSASVILWLTF